MTQWQEYTYLSAGRLVSARALFRLYPLYRWLLLLLAAVVTVLVAAYDYATGSTIETAPLFMIPTVVVAVLLGTAYGLLFAAADIALDSYDMIFSSGPAYSAVEVLTGMALRIVLYVLVAYLVGRVAYIAEDNEIIADKLRSAMDTINAEINSAARSQSVLITGKTPTAPGLDIAARISYSEMVGGDFLDVREVNGVLHFCIGDIAGKGIKAALFTSILKYLALQAVDSALSPSATLEFFNRELSGFLPEEIFVTMLCGEIDGAAGTMVYASAGHERQFLLRATGEMQHLEPTGTILALRPVLDIAQNRLRLEEGDTLLFYTDGALDVMSDSGRLGIDGLRQLFVEKAQHSARGTADGLFESLVNNVVRKERDDITLLVVRRDCSTAMED